MDVMEPIPRTCPSLRQLEVVDSVWYKDYRESGPNVRTVKPSQLWLLHILSEMVCKETHLESLVVSTALSLDALSFLATLDSLRTLNIQVWLSSLTTSRAAR